ncbi:hypothetical protein EV421DRAFT_647874 [Armillaria borealis]|uniref:VWFA domain-containing protein n=1 Tax=Armillaria borealis TaxID=47425 RepID=A0AA39K231_9AGAR|nr:hypothetical protein EV421DRAFT_647874 [Armillaria borealis]
MLRKFDTVIVLDDSSSMLGPSWIEATEALSNLADMAGRYDEDGIDIYFLNDPKFGRNIKTDEQMIYWEITFISSSPRLMRS